MLVHNEMIIFIYRFHLYALLMFLKIHLGHKKKKKKKKLSIQAFETDFTIENCSILDTLELFIKIHLQPLISGLATMHAYIARLVRQLIMKYLENSAQASKLA